MISDNAGGYPGCLLALYEAVSHFFVDRDRLAALSRTERGPQRAAG